MNSAIEKSALLNMKNAGIIKDMDAIDWYSPNKLFKFEVSRYDNFPNLITTNETSRYMIEIVIKDNIGVEIYKIRMNEQDLLRFLDNATIYLYEFEFEAYSSMIVGFNPMNNYNTLDTEPRISLFRSPEYMIPNEFKPLIFDNSVDEYRDNLFRVYNYNYKTGQETDICKFYLSNGELDNFIFDLYFVGLIDIPNIDQEKETLLGRMYGEYGYIESC